jgi:branched-chain amino acid transport system ATP-binding protein
MTSILKIKNIHKHFGGIHALDSCSLEIEKGKITAIIGPNGSGKSTLFNVLSQIIDEDSGTIFLEEGNITNLEDYKIARSGISRTFQDVRLFKNLTIKDHLEIALSNTDEKLLLSLFKEKQNHEKRINEILKIVGLDKPLDTYATNLSYGQRKLLDLAVAIAKPHKVLLLDEPVAGVNPKLREQIKTILKKLNKQQKETIIVIEHDMNFVMNLASKIFVLDEGKVIASGKPKQIQNNKKVLEAYLGG